VLLDLEGFRPDVLLAGSDWARPKKYLRQLGVTWADLERLRITLAFAPRPTDGPSSTKQREAEQPRTVRISGVNGLPSGTYTWVGE
jgi:hypothetical protein